VLPQAGSRVAQPDAVVVALVTSRAGGAYRAVVDPGGAAGSAATASNPGSAGTASTAGAAGSDATATASTFAHAAVAVVPIAAVANSSRAAALSIEIVVVSHFDRPLL